MDERAIAGYERVSRAFPKTNWAEQAQYLSARLRFIAGEYLKRAISTTSTCRPTASTLRFGTDASYERALCGLETDQPGASVATFERLAARATDRRSKARCATWRRFLALSNQKELAVTAFSSVARSEPLSFYGLAARARLAIVGAAEPPLIAR